MIKLYDSIRSGNAWKVRLALRYLGIPFERVSMVLAEGPHKTPEFKSWNRFQRVPVLELEDGRHLGESNAILQYIAEGTELLPGDAFERAQVAAWFSFDQADLSRFLAFPRFYAMTDQTEQRATEIELCHGLGHAALKHVEEAVAARPFVMGDRVTIADFALYPYIKLAPEGGYDLSAYPAIHAWFDRIEALKSYEPLLEQAAA